MFYFDIQYIITLTECIRDIERKTGSAYQFLRIALAVHLDRSKGSHTFQLQEVAFSGLFMNGEMLLVGGGTMQIAVLQLAVTVIIVQITRHIHPEGSHLLCDAVFRSLAEGYLPVLIQTHNLSFSLLFGCRERNLRTSHRHAGSHGNASLSGMVHGTIEMVNHTLMLQHITLMGEHIIIRFGRINQVGSLPVLPVHQVPAHGKGIVGIVFSLRIKGREIEHDIIMRELHDLCISRNDARSLMKEDRIACLPLGCAERQTAPGSHVAGEGDTDAFCLQLVGRVDASGIIEHDERFAQRLVPIPVDGTFIMGEFLPPLCTLVVDRENRRRGCFPRMSLGDIAFGRSHTHIERLADGLIARTFSTEIAHPVATFVFCHLIGSVPGPVYQRRISCTLVHIPSLVGIAEQAAQGFPLQQVIAGSEPCFIPSSIGSVLAVVYHIGHKPAVSFTVHHRTVYLVVVVLRSYHYTVFIRRLHLVVYLLHHVFADFLCKNGDTAKDKKR